jgi:DNA-3-methyladenine glycosylase II
MRRLPRYPGFPDAAQQSMRTHWEALSRAIVFQQLATAAATTIHQRVCAIAGRGERFPESRELLACAEPTLRAAGLSRNKIAALRDLATHVHERRLDLDRLHLADDEEIIERLVAVRGIGEWSAQMFLLFRLGRLDVGAAGDLGVREGLRILDGSKERPTPKAALERMEAWRPLRSVGCWMMWRLVELTRREGR